MVSHADTHRIGDKKYDVPRDPGAYEWSGHSKNRRRKRTDGNYETIVEECIAHGEIKECQDRRRRFFEADVDGETCRIVVALEEHAFESDVFDHAIISLYPLDDDSRRGYGRQNQDSRRRNGWGARS